MTSLMLGELNSRVLNTKCECTYREVLMRFSRVRARSSVCHLQNWFSVQVESQNILALGQSNKRPISNVRL
jgi:hypothetical protein